MFQKKSIKSRKSHLIIFASCFFFIINYHIRMININMTRDLYFVFFSKRNKKTTIRTDENKINSLVLCYFCLVVMKFFKRNSIRSCYYLNWSNLFRMMVEMIELLYHHIQTHTQTIRKTKDNMMMTLT